MGNSSQKLLSSVIFYPPKRDPHEWNSLKDHMHFIKYKNSENDNQSNSITTTISSWWWSSSNKNQSCSTSFYIVPPSDESKLDEKSQILVFSHGNASDILSMLPWAKHVAFLSGRFVVLYDYEGYGLSSGSPSESGCYQSLAKVIDYLIKQFRVNKEQMLLMGESLGTGVVVHYAWENKWIKPIVLISPYKTIVSVAIDSFMHTPMDQFESISKISELQCPVKIYHGKKDQLIPVEHARALLSKLPQQYYIAPTYFKNADHDNILSFIHPMELVAYF